MVCSVPAASASSVRRRSTLAPPAPELTIDQGIGLFLDSLINRGASESSVITQAQQIRRFFRRVLDEPLRTVTAGQLQSLTTALAAARHKQTGHLLSHSTQFQIREAARRFCKWCVAQGRLPPAALGDSPPEQMKSELATLRRDVGRLRQELAEARAQLRTAQGAR